MRRLGIVLLFLLGSFLMGCHEPEPMQPVCYPMYCQPCPQICPQVCTPSCGSYTPVVTQPQPAVQQPATQPYTTRPSLPVQ